MKTKNKYFLNFAIMYVILFVIGSASLIYAVIDSKNVPSAKQTDAILGLVALLIYVIILAVLFYQALKGYFLGSRLVSVIMVTDRGEKNPKSYLNALIFGIVFAAIFLFFALNSFKIINATKFFTLSLNLTLTNFSLMICSTGFYLYLYKPEKKNIEE